MKLAILVLFVSWIGGAAQGLTLPPLPNSNVKLVDVDPDADDTIPCEEIVDRLEKYNLMAREQDQSVATFLLQTTDKIMDWYELLNPYEGQQSSLPVGLFLPLRDGSELIGEVTNLAFDSAELLSLEMDRILTSLNDCQIQSKPEQ